MKLHNSLDRKIFLFFTYIFLALTALVCILPLVHILAISLSSGEFAAAGEVKLWPVGTTLDAYEYVIGRVQFIKAFYISAERVVLGLVVNLTLTLLSAYVLSRDEKKFKGRKFYVWYFIITILFSGGLVPGYLVVKGTGLIDKIWALILPGAVPVFSVILLMNFFKGLPKELEEAAFIDGASHWRTLFNVYVPVSKPGIATVTLLMLVGHWNSWFDGLIFMNTPDKYPLQTYLQTIIVIPVINVATVSDFDQLPKINEKTTRAAQIFVAMIPILMVYPFLQKYFTKGLVLGSVKG
jgi:ABC-type sugar transport system, permease component